MITRSKTFTALLFVAIFFDSASSQVHNTISNFDTIYLQVFSEGNVTFSVIYNDTLILDNYSTISTTEPKIIIFNRKLSLEKYDTFPISIRKGKKEIKLMVCTRNSSESDFKYLIIIRRRVFLVFRQWYYFWDEGQRRILD